MHLSRIEIQFTFVTIFFNISKDEFMNVVYVGWEILIIYINLFTVTLFLMYGCIYSFGWNGEKEN